MFSYMMNKHFIHIAADLIYECLDASMSEKYILILIGK